MSKLMTNIDFGDTIAKLAYTVAAAAVLGGGATVLDTASRTSVLEAQQTATQEQLNRIESKIDRIYEIEAEANRGSRQ